MSTAIVNSPATALPLVMPVQLHTATPEKSLLRFSTAGSVDDGKSTLIGRLLYDSKAIFEDQLDAVERSSRERGLEYTNLALLTDGLRHEGEQRITRDVTYGHCEQPAHSYSLLDC